MFRNHEICFDLGRGTSSDCLHLADPSEFMQRGIKWRSLKRLPGLKRPLQYATLKNSQARTLQTGLPKEDNLKRDKLLVIKFQRVRN